MLRDGALRIHVLNITILDPGQDAVVDVDDIPPELDDIPIVGFLMSGNSNVASPMVLEERPEPRDLLRIAIESWLQLCREERFKPLSEDDWVALLFAEVIRESGDATHVHVKTRIQGFDNKWDLVIGPTANDYFVVPQVVAEIKFVARAFSDQQSLHLFEEARDRDVPKLAAVASHCESASLLVFDEVDWFRRSRFRDTGVSRLETLVSHCAERKVQIQHYPLNERKNS